MRSAAVSRPLSPVPRAPAFTASDLTAVCCRGTDYAGTNPRSSRRRRSANPPALVHVAMSFGLRHLDGGAVDARRYGVDARVHRDLLGIRSVRQRLGEDPAIEIVALSEAEQGEDGRRHVHVAYRHPDHRALLE